MRAEAQAAMQRVMAARGANTRYGRDLAARLRAHGLVDMRAQARMAICRADLPGRGCFAPTSNSCEKSCCAHGLAHAGGIGR